LFSDGGSCFPFLFFIGVLGLYFGEVLFKGIALYPYRYFFSAGSCFEADLISEPVIKLNQTDGEVQDVGSSGSVGFNGNAKFSSILPLEPVRSEIPSLLRGWEFRQPRSSAGGERRSYYSRGLKYVEGDLKEAINYLDTTPAENIDFGKVKGFAFDLVYGWLAIPLEGSCSSSGW
jgi:hypothetical protein